MTKVGPSTSPLKGGEVSGEVGGEVEHDTISIKLDIKKLTDLISFCEEPRSRTEMQAFCGIKSQDYFRNNTLI